MKLKKLTTIVSTIAMASIAVADMGSARFSVEVIDEQAGTPMNDVPVIGCFLNKYMRGRRQRKKSPRLRQQIRKAVVISQVRQTAER